MSRYQSPPVVQHALRAKSTAASGTAQPLQAPDSTTKRYLDHSDAPRINTDVVITKALKQQYPALDLVVTPRSYGCDLLGFAASGLATATPIATDNGPLPSSLQWTVYIPPARRSESAKGYIGDYVIFGKYLYKWNNEEFIVYIADGRDGNEAYPMIVNHYILGTDKQKIDELILTAGAWASDLHDEILVFDGGDWSKSGELWQSVEKATWDAVILDEKMKQALIDDHLSFFESRDTYKDLQVPWKRGIIYHGPPGNGEYWTSLPSLIVEKSLTSHR